MSLLSLTRGQHWNLFSVLFNKILDRRTNHFFFSQDNWDDWGNESLAKAQTDDEKKKQREEKRIQRQKELEAKRAAKKGPMKLGAKKSSSSAPSNDPFDALL